MQRRSPRRKMVNTFEFPIADGTVKLSGGDRVFRKSTTIRDQKERGEEFRYGLRGESDGSQPSDTEPRNDFWSIEGQYTNEPGDKLHVHTTAIY